MALILLVDDETSHVKILEKIFRRDGHRTLVAHNAHDALTLLRKATETVQVVITDLMMPGMSGMDLLKAIKALTPETEVILMTAFGTVEKAVEAMKGGACDFVTKPIKRAELLKSVRQALDRQALIAENRSLKAQLADLQAERSIIGTSQALKTVVDMIKQVAPSRATVLITGESGTGKELIARAIHDLSDRREKPWVAVNCAALPESIMEAELFGTERGAFTDSTRRQGRFEAADKGTLFLDEVGELPPTVQVKLLRVLQEGEIVRLGSNTPITVNVRIVAATNRNLTEEIQSGRFREDLYYRLNVINIRTPPLRARAEDIPLLTHHFVQHYAKRNAKPIPRLTHAAQDALGRYSWPGNVRELQNAIERAIVLDKDSTIDLDDLPDHIASSTRGARQITIPIGTPLDVIERRVIKETLHMTGGDKKLTAQLLGIATRTIYRKMDTLESDDE